MTGTDAVQFETTVSGNGQVSIPASTRARWKAKRLTIVDLGDRVVMRSLGENPVAELRGSYRELGPDSDTARDRARRDDR